MNFTFEYPFAYLLLMLYFLCKKYCIVNLKEVYFSNVNVLLKIAQKEKNISTILEFLIVFFIVTAIASPVTKHSHIVKNSQGYEILLTLDASESMRDDDRFDTMKTIVGDFIKKRKYDRLGLTLFAQNVYIASPFTYEKKPLQEILQYIQIGVAGSNGTSLYDALYSSASLFKKSESKNKVCILLTDGIDTKNNIPLDAAIANAKKYGVKVYVIGVGNEGEYNKDVLKTIAKKTGGMFFETSDPKKLNNIYDTINSLEKSDIETDTIIYLKYYFYYPVSLALLLLIFYIYFTNKYKNIYLSLCLIFLTIALFRPSYQKSNHNIQSDIEILTAIDISKSMLAQDIKPNRFEFAKKKLQNMMQSLSKEKIAILAFSNQPYLISSFSNNYKTLDFLLQNLTLKNINQNGTEYLKFLKSANSFFEKDSKKAIIIFSDGGEQKEFTKSIEYAKQNNITVFIYQVATQNGSVIKIDNKLTKDINGNIVISKANESIKNLANQTNAIYQEYSFSDNDIKPMIEKIKKEFDKNNIINKSKNNIELFYLPLLFGFLLFLLGRFNFQGKVK